MSDSYVGTPFSLPAANLVPVSLLRRKMNTYCWKDTAFVIHVRVDCQERIQNLNKVINHLRASSPEIQLIIIEDDKESNPTLKHLLTSSLLRAGDKYRLLPNEGAYRRPFAYNLGANMTDRDVIGFLDTDVIVHPASLDMVRRCLIDRTFDFMWPFNGVALYLTEAGREAYFKAPLIETLGKLLPKNDKGVMPILKENLFLETPYLRVENIQSRGGIAMMHKDCFNTTGGWNIDFQGWGYEDNEIEVRMAKLGQKIGRVQGPAEVLFHLWHPRDKSNASSDPNHEHLDTNMGIFEAVKEAGPDKIKEWVKVQKEVVKTYLG